MAGKSKLPITAAFAAIAELLRARGHRDLSKTTPAGRLVTERVGEEWVIRLNPHGEVVDGVPPFSAAVSYRGTPFGLVSPFDGVMAAMPGVDQDTFVAAVREAARKEGKR